MRNLNCSEVGIEKANELAHLNVSPHFGRSVYAKPRGSHRQLTLLGGFSGLNGLFLSNHPNRKIWSTDNASARLNLARALDSKPDALKKTGFPSGLLSCPRGFAARQSGKAWNRNSVRRKNPTNDDIWLDSVNN